jgi:hypothetical protein
MEELKMGRLWQSYTLKVSAFGKGGMKVNDGFLLPILYPITRKKLDTTLLAILRFLSETGKPPSVHACPKP